MRVCPVTMPALSIKEWATSATSSGVATRPKGGCVAVFLNVIPVVIHPSREHDARRDAIDAHFGGEHAGERFGHADAAALDAA